MPDLDALAAIGQGSERLLHKVTENVELCKAAMGLIALMALEADRRGADLGGVTIGHVEMSGLRMKAKVKFSRTPIRRPVPAIPSVNSFMHFLKAEAEGLYLFIAQNPDVLTWLEAIVTRMEAHARFKSVDFGAITFNETRKAGDASAAFLDKEDNLVLEMDP